VEDEFNHVIKRSTQNKLTVSFNKTKELIFQRPGLRNFQDPTVMDNIERSNTFKLLGSSLSSTLSMDFQVSYIISIACQFLLFYWSIAKTRFATRGTSNCFSGIGCFLLDML
jgi:hypothetical protein